MSENPVPFSVMSGEGDDLTVGKEKYIVKPMLISDALKFADDGLSLGPQIFNLGNEESRAKLDKYLQDYCTNKNGDAMSIERIATAQWDIVHLRQFVRKLLDISG